MDASDRAECAVIELRELVVAANAKPLSTVLRAGEVVRVDGPPALVSALLDVIAGRRAPWSGNVIRGDETPLVVRAGEQLPRGAERDAIALWSAFADRPRSLADVRDTEVVAAHRGRALDHGAWLVDGALAPNAEAIVQTAADHVRAGRGLLLWTAGEGRERSDRTLVVEATQQRMPRKRAVATRRERASGSRDHARAILRFAVASACSRSAIALAALAAAWLALAASVVTAHEGYWYPEGAAAAFEQLAHVAVAGIAIIASVAAAVTAASTRAWSAMLAETRAPRSLRWLAVLAGDLGAVGLAAVVAMLPAMWSFAIAGRDPSGVACAVARVLAAASCAAIVTRLVRWRAVAEIAGALVGAAVACALC